MYCLTALPDDFLDLTFEARGAAVAVIWSYTETCWGLVQGYTVELIGAADTFATLGAGDTEFTLTDCALMGSENQYNVRPILSPHVDPFVKGPFSIGKDYCYPHICTCN